MISKLFVESTSGFKFSPSPMAMDSRFVAQDLRCWDFTRGHPVTDTVITGPPSATKEKGDHKFSGHNLKMSLTSSMANITAHVLRNAPNHINPSTIDIYHVPN